MPYQEDIRAALEALREEEFRAGRFYQPSHLQPSLFGRLFGRPPSKPNRPASIREAIRIADRDATGTRSILDMEGISESPDYGAVSPVAPEELRRLLGTDQPTRELAAQCEELFESIDRGQGIYVITYEQGRPDGIFFAGYSFYSFD